MMETEAAEVFASRLRNTGARTAAGSWFSGRLRTVGQQCEIELAGFASSIECSWLRSKSEDLRRLL